jgi:hypothetical protein
MSGNWDKYCRNLLLSGKNVAVVFYPSIPETYKGFKVIDGDEKSTVIFAVFQSLNVDIMKEYRLRNSLDREITEELNYFFGGEGVRVMISSIEFSEEYEEKIESVTTKMKK